MAKRKPSNQTSDDGFVTRSVNFPADVYERIKEDAARNRRPVSQHIVWLLERALQPGGDRSSCSSFTQT